MREKGVGGGGKGHRVQGPRGTATYCSSVTTTPANKTLSEAFLITIHSWIYLLLSLLLITISIFILQVSIQVCCVWQRLAKSEQV